MLSNALFYHLLFVFSRKHENGSNGSAYTLCYLCIEIRKLNKICYLMLSYLMSVYANISENLYSHCYWIFSDFIAIYYVHSHSFIISPFFCFLVDLFALAFFSSSERWNKIYVLPLNCVCEIEMILMERQLNIQWTNLFPVYQMSEWILHEN